jgi:flagellar biosynthesis protein
MDARRARRIKAAYRDVAEREVTRSQQAVALGYDPDKDGAPRVLAAGRGLLAEQIISIAGQQGIPIREDTLLAAALAQVELDAEIPPELYALVAEVLAYVYRLREIPSSDY